MRYAMLFTLVLGALCLGADQPADTTPRSPDAKSALAKAEHAQAEATAAWHKAMDESRRQLLVSLQAAREKVMAAGGADALAEATRIQTVIDQTKDTLANEPEAGKDKVSKVLTRQRIYRYGWLANGDRTVEFLPNGKIGTGAAGRTQQWQVRRDNGQEVLVLSGQGERIVLRPNAGGFFAGTGPGGVKIVLLPEQ